MSAYQLAAAASFALAISAFGAQANIITFGTAPQDAYFTTGPITEDGFIYSSLAGDLYVQMRGNPNPSMSGPFVDNLQSNVLGITRDGGGAFTFAQLDYAAFDQFADPSNPNILTLTVEGYLNGGLIGSDSYDLTATKVFNPTYDNWTTELALNLFGMSLDEVRIGLFGIATPGDTIQQLVDNIVLAPAAITGVPEPISLSLFGAGFAGAAAMRRKPKKA